MKYKTYKALANAFESGELNRKEWKLIMDNDSCYLNWRGPVPKDVDEDEFYENKYEEGCKIFHGDGDCDIMEIVEALGIPAERC